jgi:hypothetical protein
MPFYQRASASFARSGLQVKPVQTSARVGSWLVHRPTTAGANNQAQKARVISILFNNLVPSVGTQLELETIGAQRFRNLAQAVSDSARAVKANLSFRRAARSLGFGTRIVTARPSGPARQTRTVGQVDAESPLGSCSE